MGFTPRQRTMFETNLARDRAEVLLRELLDTSRAVQIHNIVKGRPGMNCIDGLDTAISSARQLVHILNDSLCLAEHDLVDDEMIILDELGLPGHDEGQEVVSLEEEMQAENLLHHSTEMCAESAASS